MKIVIDTETTGVSSFDEILQVSIISDAGETLFDKYIKPKYKESWFMAERIHGISPEMVENCPDFDFYREEIQSIIDSADEIIGYNFDFDLKFLKRAGINFNDKTIYDVMFAFSEIYGDWNPRFNNYKWKKLTTCASYYSYEWEEAAHNSLGDVKATLYCYNKVKEQLAEVGG